MAWSAIRLLIFALEHLSALVQGPSRTDRPLIQVPFHADLTLDISISILLLNHDKANLEMGWSSGTPKPARYIYRLANYTPKTPKNFLLRIIQIGKITILTKMLARMQRRIFFGENNLKTSSRKKKMKGVC